TIYVDISATGNNDGSSWIHAFVELEDALAVANVCSTVDTIKVAAGTYYPDALDEELNVCGESIMPPLNREKSFQIPSDLILLGGYPSGGADYRNWDCNKTILSGDIDRDGTLAGNSFHIVYTINVSETTTVDGFYITGGNADTPDDLSSGPNTTG